MDITILGTRGLVDDTAEKYKNHSGILIDDKILIDAGEKEYLELNPDCIFITHLHPDHAFFEEEDATIDIPVYAPEPGSVECTVISSFEKIDVGSYTITAIPIIHSVRVKSLGYMVEKDKKFLYTSDLVRPATAVLPDMDMVITDGSFIRHHGLIRKTLRGLQYGHNGIPDLVNLFSDITDFIVITHYGSWFYKDIEESIKKIESLGNDVTVKAAYDGMVISL